MLTRLWQYCIGYVMIKIRGLSLERLMNLAIKSKIKLFDCTRSNYTTLEARVNYASYKKARRLLEENHCEIIEEQKKGIPCFAATLWRRKYFILGAITCVALVYALTSFIWVVEIQPRGEIDVSALQKRIAAIGIKPGLFKGDLDTEDIENSIMMSDSSLGWVGITVNGVVLRLEAVEAPKPPVMMDYSIPTHIIASKDAYITKLTVYNGWVVVKEGKTVKKGDLLVSGINQNANGEIRYAHANARITGKVWYTGRAGAPVTQTVQKRTGRMQSRRYLRVGGWKIFLDEGAPSFSTYQTETKRDSLAGLYIPVSMVTETYYEIENIEAERDLIQLKKDLEREAVKRALAALPDEAGILNVNLVFIIKADNTTEAQAFIESTEEIGMEEKIINP